MKPLDKIVPFSIEAEEALLGSLLLDSQAYERVANLVAAHDFHGQANRWVFEAVEALANRAEAIDFLTVCEEIERRGHMDAIGGRSFVTSLINTVPTSIHAEYYAGIVKDTSVRRALIKAGSNIAKLAYQEDKPLADVLADAEGELTQASGGYKPIVEPVLLADAFAETLAYIDDVREGQGDARLLATGWPDVDALVTGWGPGELVIVAARPGMGKSGFLLRTAGVAAANGTPATLFSLEMGRQELVNRLVCASSGVPLSRLRRPDVLTEGELDRVKQAMGFMDRYPLYLDDRCNVSVQDVMATINRQRRKHDIGLVAVDYVQLMDDAGDDDDAVRTLGKLTRALKKFARQNSIPVLLGCQLNRSCEARQNKRPMLSDLRQSGRIEEDADIVAMLYRDDYYTDLPVKPERSEAEVLIRKNRNGAPGVAYLDFVHARAWFENASLKRVRAA